MSTAKSITAIQPKLGELFVEAGVLTPKVVSECLSRAHHNQVPVGEELMGSGHVSAPELQSALQTQELVRNGEVSKQSAVRIIRRTCSAKITIEEAQAQELCDRAFTMPFSTLGKLLCAAEVLPEQALVTATRSTTQQLPLGRFLVGERAITKETLADAINCLILVRDGKISRYQAANILRFLQKHKDSEFARALEHHSLGHLVYNGTPKLLSLLTSAQLISQADADWCLEIAVETGRQTGQVLVLYGLIEDALLDSALSLQQMLADKTLPISRASEVLSLCKETQTTLEALLAELNQLNHVVSLFRRATVIDENQIAKLATSISDFESNCGAILVREGIVSHEMLMDGIRVLEQIESKKISEAQAISFLRAKFHSKSKS
jgi:hypothetical protein